MKCHTGFCSVQGIKIGPDGRIWFVDQSSNGVYRINAPGVGLGEETISFDIYPNPSNGTINIFSSNAIDGVIEMRNLQGQLVHSTTINGHGTSLEANVAAGTYIVAIVSEGVILSTDKVIIH